MKAVQSYIPFNSYLNPEAVINKEYAYLALLSSLQLKKLYGSVTLYTSDKLAEHFSSMSFPYEYNTSIDGERATYFAAAKLRTFMDQKEPFVHYDLDTLVFEKPDLESKKSPFVFSHPDMPNAGYFKKDRLWPKKKHKAVNTLLQDVWFHNLMDSYLLAYYNTTWLPEKYPSHLINPNNIPNMNLIGVKDVDTFSKATAIAMEIADKNEKIFTNNWLASNFIEQLTIPLYLQLLNKDYATALERHSLKDPVGSPFMFLKDPFTVPKLGTSEEAVNKQMLHLPEYPFTFQNYYACGECLDWHHKDTEITSKADLLDNMDLSKVKYAHIGGANKAFVLWQAMIIHTLLQNYGEEVIFKVTDHYRKRQMLNNVPFKLSDGEKTYEMLTGNKLFSKEFISRKKTLS